MKALNELDTVVLTRDLPEHDLKQGDVGAIVHVYGEAAAYEFARQGAKVALLARRTERLDALKEAIEAAGGQALAVACDVTDRASVDTAVAQTVDTFGGLDVALANAGFGVRAAAPSRSA